MSDDELPELEEFGQPAAEDYARTREEIAAAQREESAPLLRAMAAGISQPRAPPPPPTPKVLDDSPLEALKRVGQNLSQNKDLLGLIAQNKVLREGFADPQMMAAFSDIAANPQNFEKYAGNPRLTAFLQEYVTLLQGQVQGDPLKTSAAKPAQSPPQIVEVEVDRVLKDPQVQSLIAAMGSDGRFDFVAIARTNPSLAAKVRFLLEKGVFQVK